MILLAPLGVDWGDVPTWVGAVTTALALVVAGLIWRIERNRDATAKDTADKARQADSVATWPVWLEPGRVVEDPVALLHTTDTRGAWAGLLRNGSNLPIFEVTMVYVVSDRAGENVTRHEVTYPVDAYPPGDHYFMWANNMHDRFSNEEMAERGTLMNWEKRVRQELRFTDAAGIAWVRQANGKLEKVTD